ncbi:NAP-domain-containing protein [Neoconidiobolus thromboides FSU 785]|nr:NAP-domain-containing protein [Neoconidiobolus thromboides FSU 785]
MSAELENKFGSIPQVEDQSFYDTLPETIAKRVYGLKSLQAEQHALEKKFHEETMALEKKYYSLYKPILDKRSEIINGKTEPSEEQIATGKEIANQDEEGITRKGPKPDIKQYEGVPEFWLMVFKNNISLAEIITERDEDALVHLQDVQIEYLEEGLGYTIHFLFNSNEYFTNEKLSKSYYFKIQEPSGTLGLDHSVGSEIEWKEGKNLTVITKSRKQRNKDTNQTRIIKNTEPTDSFFNFFTSKALPTEENMDEIDEEDFENYGEIIDEDFQLGEEIKEKIVPHAIDWYTGKALEYEGFDFDAEEYEQDYEQGSSDEEDQVEELDDETYNAHKQ